MFLRIFRGRVIDGRVVDFVDLVRRQVVTQARDTHGLLAFMAGYRRQATSDEFVLISAWETTADIVRVVGEATHDRPSSIDVLAGIGEMTRVDEYRLLDPVNRGILDAPGAVIRVTEAIIRPGRKHDLLLFIEEKNREINAVQMVLAFGMGIREGPGGVEEAVGVSAWSSPLMIEAFAETGRQRLSLFAALDEFISDVRVEQYQAIELQLPEGLRDLGGRRLIAARFPSPSAATNATSAIEARFPAAAEAGVLVAPLADARANGNREQQLLVARLALDDYLAAERLIVDLGGDVVYAVDEQLL